MKKIIIRKNLVLVVILLFFIIALEPTIGRNIEFLHETNCLPDFKKGCLSMEDDKFNDIIVTNREDNGKISILLGNGTGGFSLFKSISLGGELPEDLVTDDFNKDGFLDLAVPWYIFADVFKFTVFLGAGGGVFGEPVNYSTKTFNDGITSGDFNNDDNVDLAVLCTYSHNAQSFMETFLGDGNGSFIKKSTLTLPKEGAYRLTSGDFNNDSFLDVAIVSDYLSQDFLTITFGNGTGQFSVDQTYQKGKGDHSVEITTNDFNKDGFLDLATTNNIDHDVSVFYNDGNGNFTNRQDFSTGDNSFPKCLISDDFNNDGFPDLAVTIRKKVSILLGNGTGGFNTPVAYNVGSSWNGNDVIADDFNGDDILDLVVTNRDDNTVTFLCGYGNGTFGDRQDFFAGNHPYGIVAGNFNPAFISNLNCEGTLNWSKVEPGSNLTGNFTVENIGHLRSKLNWEIKSFPEWGNWTFIPSNGYNLTPEDGKITVNVSVVAPDKKNSEFFGEVTIFNKDNISDFCIIDVSLATPKNKIFNITPFPLFQRFLESHPQMFLIIQQLRGLK